MFTGGCVMLPAPSFIQEVHNLHPNMTPLAQGETVVVLGENLLSDEADVVRCVRKELQGEQPQLQIVSTREFRDAQLTPWASPEATKHTVEELTRVFTQPRLKAKIEQLRLRYLIEVTGGTVEGGIKGPWFVIAGVGWAKRESTLSVRLWDLKRLSDEGTAGVTVGGHIGVLTWVFLSAFFMPATETPACNKVGEQLRAFLIGRPFAH